MVNDIHMLKHVSKVNLIELRFPPNLPQAEAAEPFRAAKNFRGPLLFDCGPIEVPGRPRNPYPNIENPFNLWMDPPGMFPARVPRSQSKCPIDTCELLAWRPAHEKHRWCIWGRLDNFSLHIAVPHVEPPASLRGRLHTQTRSLHNAAKPSRYLGLFKISIAGSAPADHAWLTTK